MPLQNNNSPPKQHTNPQTRHSATKTNLKYNKLHHDTKKTTTLHALHIINALHINYALNEW